MPVPAWGQIRNNAPLTNASIVKLVKAGFKEKSIITIIASRPVSFDLSTDRIIELKRTGISEKVILAMMARQEGVEFSDEAWGDEEFFNQSSNPTKDPTKTDNSNDGSSAEIFGSSGGSKGSTRTRGGNGSSSGDTDNDRLGHGANSAATDRGWSSSNKTREDKKPDE